MTDKIKASIELEKGLNTIVVDGRVYEVAVHEKVPEPSKPPVKQELSLKDIVPYRERSELYSDICAFLDHINDNGEFIFKEELFPGFTVEYGTDVHSNVEFNPLEEGWIDHGGFTACVDIDKSRLFEVSTAPIGIIEDFKEAVGGCLDYQDIEFYPEENDVFSLAPGLGFKRTLDKLNTKLTFIFEKYENVSYSDQYTLCDYIASTNYKEVEELLGIIIRG